MMTPPKFSIITVCFNASANIERTLESVRLSKYEHVEHIIVDGNSTDRTIQIITRYRDSANACNNGHNVVLYIGPDDGIYDAMNHGLALAQGDYVCFLNAGDCLPDDHTLGCIAQCIVQNACYGDALHADSCRPAVVYGDTLLTDEKGNIVGKRHLSAPEQLTLHSFRRGMLVCHQAFYVRADIAKAIPYDLQYRFSADYDWCLRVLRQCQEQSLSCLNMHRVVAHYLQEGTTTRNHTASLKERFRIMKLHYGLATTLFQHFLFLFRALIRKINSLLSGRITV